MYTFHKRIVKARPWLLVNKYSKISTMRPWEKGQHLRNNRSLRSSWRRGTVWGHSHLNNMNKRKKSGWHSLRISLRFRYMASDTTWPLRLEPAWLTGWFRCSGYCIRGLIGHCFSVSTYWIDSSSNQPRETAFTTQRIFTSSALCLAL